MSDSARGGSRIVPAEQAFDLPAWTLAPFPNGQHVARRRPLSDAERQENRQQERLAAAAAAQTPQAPVPVQRPAAPAPVPVPPVDPQVVDDIKRAAFDEGYAAGYDLGAAAAHDESTRLRALADAASSVFTRFEHELAPQLIDMAIEIARQVVRRELSSDGAVILAVVRDAFAQMTGNETGRQLLLNPTDAQLVRAHLGDELELGQWTVVEDPRIVPGGCHLSTLQADIDAQLPTRWKRTLAALGADAPWEGAGD